MKSPLKLALSALLALSVSFSASATTYYVNSTGGNDSNAGTSQAAPWLTVARANNGPAGSGSSYAPGDQLLFACQGVWSGTQLHPLGSGTSGNPIILSSYGTGALPILNGNGVTNGEVLLSNQPYWEISNLEITNQSTTAGQYAGVSIEASDFGVVNHIYLTGLFVHDVTGVYSNKLSCGIIYNITGTTTATYYNDIKVENCEVLNVTEEGIQTASTWQTRPGGPVGAPVWTPSTNVVFRGNTVENIAGDGFVMRVASNALLERNVCRLTGFNSDISSVGMWTINSNGTVLQNCEIYDTQKPASNADGTALDFDYWNNNIIYQYNYTHDNQGGCFEVAASGSAFPSGFTNDCIFRYNISQNDSDRVMRPTGIYNGIFVYNNVFYVPSGSGANLINCESFGGWGNDLELKNNIIYNLGSGGYNYGSSTGNVTDHNLFYGNHPSSEPADAAKLTTDPMFAAVGSGGVGLGSVDGYSLLAGSPALSSGVLISSNGGFDYFGNTVSSSAAPSRGAYNGAGLGSYGNGLVNYDVGGTGLAGSATFASSIWTVAGAGAGISGTSDHFHYAFSPATGPATLIARVASVQNTGTGAQAGVMFRETASTYARFVDLVVTPANGITMNYRSSTMGTEAQLAHLTGVAAPYWLKLVDQAGTFTGYTSSDGNTWTSLGSVSVGFTVYPNSSGFAVTSGTTAALNSSTFDNASVSAQALTNLDIGSPSLLGGAACTDAGAWSAEGGGADIAGSSDQFHYAYQATSGDSTMIAHLLSQQDTNAWAKSGVMIRGTTAANSPEVSLVATPGNGVVLIARATAGATTTVVAQNTGLAAPCWLKLIRSGGTNFYGYTSSDGNAWTLLGSTSVTLPTTATQGLAVTAADNTQKSTAKFDNVVGTLTTP